MFEGDIFNSLGEKHPTVYFSNISVYDQRVQAQLNLFVEDIVLRHMSKLFIYLVPIYDDDNYQKIISDPFNVVSRIYDIRETNHPRFVGTTPPTTPASTTANYFTDFIVSKPTPIGTRNYNANDNEYIKLVGEKTIFPFDEGLANLEYLSFVTFTSYLNPGDIERLASRRRFNSFVLDEVSNISFCRTVVDSMVVNEPFQTYLDGEQVYHKPVLENLNGAYRANELTEFNKFLANIKRSNQSFANSEESAVFKIEKSSSLLRFNKII